MTDTSLRINEIFISHKVLGETITYSIIASNTGISIDSAYDEMISELLDEFPILGWRTYILNCLNDEIVEKKNSAAMNNTIACRELYYYRMPGEKHDQDLFSNKFSNTRGMF